MGLGNGNPKSGDKGSNWRYEYSVLKALAQISTNTGGGSSAGLATEATLLLKATEATQLNVLAEVTAINAGTPAALGQALMAASTPVAIASNQSAIPVSGTVTTNEAVTITGGSTPYMLIAANTTNAISIKGTPGKVYGIQCGNLNAAARYLKLYNKASAPNPAADTPVMVIMIPGNTAGAGNNVSIPAVGIQFTLGIAILVVTGIAATDATAVAASEITINIQYN